MEATTTYQPEEATMMDLSEFLRLAEEFSKLGGSIQEQLISVHQCEPMEEQNANALGYIVTFLNDACDSVEGAGDLAEEIQTHLDENQFDEMGF